MSRGRIIVIASAAALILIAGSIITISAVVRSHGASTTDPRGASAALPGQNPRTDPERTPPLVFRPTASYAELQIISYPLFTIGYDNTKKSPLWVVYTLDGPIMNPGAEPRRPAAYLTDENTSARVRHDDYPRSGYERGLLCPAYTMFSRFGALGRDSTCIMSNAVPVVPELNAGPWAELEQRIAGRAGGPDGWAATVRHLTVITGPIFSSSRTLPSGIPIPDSIFAVVLQYQPERQTYRALAFELPNRPRVEGPLASFLVSIEQIEENSGVDIFAGVDVPIRAAMEENTAPGLWP